MAVGKLDETAGVTELLSSSIEGSVDSLDVWKNYVLVGSQDLKLVNIDKHNSRNLLGSREVHKNHTNNKVQSWYYCNSVIIL